mgnify:CR=1 FL=1
MAGKELDAKDRKDKKQRILIVKESLRWMGLAEAWKQHGYEVLPDKWNLDGQSGERVFQILRRLKHQEGCKLVVSIHFLAQISNACEKLGVLYISWIVDSPHIHLFMSEARNPVNRIFSFDMAQCSMLQAKGFEHIYHLPCCVGTGVVEGIISNDGGKKRERYGSDVARQLYHFHGGRTRNFSGTARPQLPVYA